MMTRTIAEDFLDQVDGWILVLMRDAVGDFDQLLRRLPGVYPRVVVESLRRLRERGSIGLSRFDQLFSGVRHGGQPSVPDVYEALPIPHPLDFDWRFTKSTISHLLDVCQSRAGCADSLAILGAPTVFFEAVQHFPLDRLRLFDANPLTIHSLQQQFPVAKIVECDLVSDTPVSKNDVATVITDPPWYQEQLHCFLWSASRLCRNGGYVLSSLPPRGTRPGVMCERAELLDWAEGIGIKLLQVEEGALRYVTPPFERNSLRAANIVSVPADWRTGDLAVFCCDENVRVPRPVYHSLVCDWEEVCVGRVRFKLRRKNSVSHGNPALRSIVSGDVLDSVSRRDSRIDKVDIWTSGNRVFACENPRTLRTIIQALNARIDPVEQVATTEGGTLVSRESDQVHLAARQVAALVEAEAAEL